MSSWLLRILQSQPFAKLDLLVFYQISFLRYQIISSAYRSSMTASLMSTNSAVSNYFIEISFNMLTNRLFHTLPAYFRHLKLRRRFITIPQSPSCEDIACKTIVLHRPPKVPVRERILESDVSQNHPCCIKKHNTNLNQKLLVAEKNVSSGKSVSSLLYQTKFALLLRTFPFESLFSLRTHLQYIKGYPVGRYTSF